MLLLLEGAISLLLAAWLLFVRERPKWNGAFAALALIVLCVAMGSCGGAASMTSGPSTTTYTLTVSASDGTQTQTANLLLNVTSQ